MILQESLRYLHVLLYTFVRINGRPCGPAEEQRFEKRSVGDRRMTRAHCGGSAFAFERSESKHTGRQKPCVLSSPENLSRNILDNIEVRAAKENRVSFGPRVGVDDQRRDMDIVIQAAALFAAGLGQSGSKGI